MLPKQILLINFLTDLPEMTIAGDNVDAEYLTQPRRWDIAFIRRFMLVFGPLSSLFDFVTFLFLLSVYRAGAAEFHTGWFVESVLSATFVVFALRTRLPILKSHPSRAMLLVTALVGLVALALPYSPLAGILGFSPLPPLYLLIVVGISLAFLASAEIAKHAFYRQAVNR
jgi:Mg2+-importing ATPase